MSAEEFEQMVGYKPIQDDLERVNCNSIGYVGHIHCGFCPKHNKPRFVCFCQAPRKSHMSEASVKYIKTSGES